MSLVYMPFPVSWFHSLPALLSVLLKRMPSKGNFWQKSWARILCSSALHYVGTSSRENPARSPRQAWLWLVPMSPQSEVSPWSQVSPRSQVTRSSWPVARGAMACTDADCPFQQPALHSCRQCLPSAGVSEEGKESQIEKRKKKNGTVLVFFILPGSTTM